LIQENYIHHADIYGTQSAEEIVPKLLELVSFNSVLDVGCGTGSWLKIIQDYGIDDILGVDGIISDSTKMYIDKSKVIEKDLNSAFDLNRKFDLVICLEVAEHLLPSSAEQFIESLTRHSDLILFSAAIPFQGGQNHLNERWTKDYWIDIFKLFNYYPIDLLRTQIWNNSKIHWWYRQNIVLFANISFKKFELPKIEFNNYVHPELYEHKMLQYSEKLELLKRNYLSGEFISFQLLIKILIKKILKKMKNIF
jgi:SAM-dependent methyltransferase